MFEFDKRFINDEKSGQIRSHQLAFESNSTSFVPWNVLQVSENYRICEEGNINYFCCHAEQKGENA